MIHSVVNVYSTVTYSPPLRSTYSACCTEKVYMCVCADAHTCSYSKTQLFLRKAPDGNLSSHGCRNTGYKGVNSEIAWCESVWPARRAKSTVRLLTGLPAERLTPPSAQPCQNPGAACQSREVNITGGLLSLQEISNKCLLKTAE